MRACVCVCFERVIMFIYMKYMSKEAEKNKHSEREKTGAMVSDKIGKIDPII